MQRMHDPTPPWDPSAVMEVEAATVQDARHGAVWRWRGRLRTAPGGMRRTVARAATAVGLAGSMPPPRRPVRPPRRLTRRRRCGIISMDGAGAPPTIRRRILKLIYLFCFAHYLYYLNVDWATPHPPKAGGGMR